MKPRDLIWAVLVGVGLAAALFAFSEAFARILIP